MRVYPDNVMRLIGLPVKFPLIRRIDAMGVRSATKDIFKAPERHEGAEQHHREEADERPRNIRPNSYPTEGFWLEVDGKSKSLHPTREDATTAAAELKRKFPVLQVMIYDAAASTRTLVEAGE
jgi:hypothetical protein